MGCNATAIHEYLIIKMHYLNSHSPWAPALAQSTSLTLICPWVAVGLYHCSGFNMNRGSNARERGWFHRAVRPLQLKCDKKNMHFLIAFNTSPVVLEDAGPDCDIPSSERKLIACLSGADNQTFGYCLQPVCCVTVSFAVFTSGTTDYDEFP